MFYNTIGETGSTLTASKAKAESQKEIITRFFNENYGMFTPFEVQSKALPDAPITSIRRAITDLTSDGILERCGVMRPGKYLKVNHTWKRSSSDYGSKTEANA
jgi:hypothetical protein